MATRVQKAKVGIFLMVMAAMIVTAVVLMRGYRGERDTYTIFFEESVLGVVPGGGVFVTGVPVGNVASIRVTDAPETGGAGAIGRAEVVIQVDPNKVTLYNGTEAELVISSLAAGTYAVSLIPPEDRSQGILPPGSIIPAKKSRLGIFTDSFATVMEKASTVIDTIAKSLEGMEEGEITQMIRDLNGSLHETLTQGQELMKTANLKIDEITDQVKPVAEDIHVLTERVGKLADETTVMVQKINVKLDEFDVQQTNDNLNSVLVEADELLVSINGAVESVNELKDRIDYRTANAEYALDRTLSELGETLAAFSELIKRLSDDPASLIRGRGEPKGN